MELGNIGTMIYLAIAPALLLLGVGTQMRVLNNRIGRILNRIRFLEQRLTSLHETAKSVCEIELDTLYRRQGLIHFAVFLNTLCALLICLVIFMLFIEDAFNLEWTHLIGSLFFCSMLSLMGSLVCFLREVFIATQTLLLSIRQILMLK